MSLVRFFDRLNKERFLSRVFSFIVVMLIIVGSTALYTSYKWSNEKHQHLSRQIDHAVMSGGWLIVTQDDSNMLMRFGSQAAIRSLTPEHIFDVIRRQSTFDRYFLSQNLSEIKHDQFSAIQKLFTDLEGQLVVVMFLLSDSQYDEALKLMELQVFDTLNALETEIGMFNQFTMYSSKAAYKDAMTQIVILQGLLILVVFIFVIFLATRIRIVTGKLDRRLHDQIK